MKIYYIYIHKIYIYIAYKIKCVYKYRTRILMLHIFITLPSNSEHAMLKIDMFLCKNRYT